MLSLWSLKYFSNPLVNLSCSASNYRNLFTNGKGIANKCVSTMLEERLIL